ncbi:hypothetical protein BCR33DRAFT_786605 [Rhizoclosmatium globosum]|uniref:Uncharacterized protein n=1 Tax=Rhizoclosmatium globosum TaxID=329046 RepID=A0A1Y2C4P6_9FUNG|nr:hypothetical protein BCR33DRAFT_786605 [Rhizoclosmatium globosum]|eukprot:ORY41864.1 hypothetical protein BCR33DRAFT_786605 [Rhizoclosmatium globosum]
MKPWEKRLIAQSLHSITGHVLEEYVTEPLGTYEKLTTGIEKTLKWRHQLHVDYEASIEGLNGNREYLNQLEATETNAQRIASALRAELGGGNAGQSWEHLETLLQSHVQQLQQQHLSTWKALAGVQGLGQRASTSFSQAASQSQMQPTKPRSRPLPQASSPPSTHSWPTKTPKQPSRQYRENTRKDSIQKDLDRFQRDKIHDLRNMLLVYAVANRDHAKRCLEAWKVAKEAVGAGEGVHTMGLRIRIWERGVEAQRHIPSFAHVDLPQMPKNAFRIVSVAAMLS